MVNVRPLDQALDERGPYHGGPHQVVAHLIHQGRRVFCRRRAGFRPDMGGSECAIRSHLETLGSLIELPKDQLFQIVSDRRRMESILEDMCGIGEGHIV